VGRLSEGDIQVLKNELQHIKDQMDKFEKKLDCFEQKLTGRLPVWATFLISALFAAVVWFSK
jgi:hypothetical protein